jgi:hypothetical protein
VTEAGTAGGGVPTRADQRALDEALDHLLDPLAPDPPSSNGAPRMPDLVPIDYDHGTTVRDLAVRIRWSDREAFRVTRRLAGWTVGLAAFVGTVWVILAVGAVR